MLPSIVASSWRMDILLVVGNRSAKSLGVVGMAQNRLEGRRKDRGATAVEYGLLVGLIAIVIIVGVSALGGRLQKIFAQLAATLGG